MAKSTPPKVAHIRLPADLHAALVAFAERTNRSLNGAAVQLLAEALDARAQGKTTPPQGTAAVTDEAGR